MLGILQQDIILLVIHSSLRGGEASSEQRGHGRDGVVLGALAAAARAAGGTGRRAADGTGANEIELLHLIFRIIYSLKVHEQK